MQRSTRVLLTFPAVLAAAALAAGCASGSSASAPSSAVGASENAHAATTTNSGPVNSPAEVLQALRSKGFRVRLYPVSGPDPSTALRGEGLQISSAIVDSGIVQAVVATPVPDHGSLVIAYVGRTATDGLRLWQQNGEYTDPQMGDALKHVPKLSTRRNVTAIYFPPNRQGLSGPDRKSEFLDAMDALRG
jgi:hypothetical protein